MPTNLNALIRYKTINNCLSTGRGYTIEELIKACSGALGEYRGKYTGVSERTIRDDLRVMKSDMLGFNAPIVQKGGVYFYSDRNFRILDILMNEAEVIRKAIKVLAAQFRKTKDPEVEDMIYQLQRVLVKSTGRELPGEIIIETHDFRFPGAMQYIPADYIRKDHPARKPAIPGVRKIRPSALTWGDVLRVVLKGS